MPISIITETSMGIFLTGSIPNSQSLQDYSINSGFHEKRTRLHSEQIRRQLVAASYLKEYKQHPSRVKINKGSSKFLCIKTNTKSKAKISTVINH